MRNMTNTDWDHDDVVEDDDHDLRDDIYGGGGGRGHKYRHGDRVDDQGSPGWSMIQIMRVCCHV